MRTSARALHESHIVTFRCREKRATTGGQATGAHRFVLCGGYRNWVVIASFFGSKRERWNILTFFRNHPLISKLAICFYEKVIAVFEEFHWDEEGDSMRRLREELRRIGHRRPWARGWLADVSGRSLSSTARGLSASTRTATICTTHPRENLVGAIMRARRDA